MCECECVISSTNDICSIEHCLCRCLLPVSQLLSVDYEKLTEALISSVSNVGSKCCFIFCTVADESVVK